jgi:hypothetical protein
MEHGAQVGGLFDTVRMKIFPPVNHGLGSNYSYPSE